MDIWLIIANGITLIGYFINWFCCYRYKEKSKILIGDMLFVILSIVSCLLLGGYAGVISYCINLVRLVTIYYKDKRHKKWYGAFAVFFILYLSVFIDNTAGLWVILLCVSNYVAFITKWFFTDTQVIRIGSIFNCLCVIPYQLYIQNYVATVLFTVTMFVAIISYIKWRKEK